MTFSGVHSAALLPLLVLLTIFILKYLTLNKGTIASHLAKEKSKRLHDVVNRKKSCHEKITFSFLDKTCKRESCNLKKEIFTVFKNWKNPKSHRKYYNFMEDIYHLRLPFQPCREVVVFTLFGSNSLGYEWRLASFRDPEFWFLDVSAIELANNGLKWEETEKIVVCCQCFIALTPDSIKRGEWRHKNSCPFEGHKAQQSDGEDDHHINCVRYNLRSGQPSIQNIFNWTVAAPNPQDSIPGNDYDIFDGHTQTVIEEPFIHVHPDMSDLRDSPDGRHISNRIEGSSADLFSGSDVIPGSNDETGLDEASGGASQEE